jgi:hypothetical protein
MGGKAVGRGMKQSSMPDGKPRFSASLRLGDSTK